MAGLLMLAGILGYRIYSLDRQREAPPAPAEAPTASLSPPPEPAAAPAPPSEPPRRAAEPTPAPAPVKAEPSSPKPSTRRLSIPKDFDPPAPAAPSKAPEAQPEAPQAPTPIPVVPAEPSSPGQPRPPLADGRTPIPVVPAPPVSAEPPDRIGILRPDRSYPGAGRPAPIRSEPPAAPEQRTPPPAPAASYQGPSAGTLIWSGQIGSNTLVTITGDKASLGRLTGELPGVPVRIELETDAFAIVEAPSPANGWKRLSLRSLKNVSSAIVIKWIVQK